VCDGAQPYVAYLLLLEVRSAPCFMLYVTGVLRVGTTPSYAHQGIPKFSPQDYLNSFSIQWVWGNQDSYIYFFIFIFLILGDLDSLTV